MAEKEAGRLFKAAKTEAVEARKAKALVRLLLTAL